jgi:hypothetical protein
MSVFASSASGTVSVDSNVFLFASFAGFEGEPKSTQFLGAAFVNRASPKSFYPAA